VAAHAYVSAEGLPVCIPAGSSPGTLLQRALPQGGDKMEKVESQAQVPENRSWEAGSLRSKPQIQSAAERTQETKS